MIFSSWATFNRLLDNPNAHGFPEWDVSRFGGSIWLDHIHPSSAVHEVVARDFSEFLRAQAAFGTQDAESATKGCEELTTSARTSEPK